MKTTNQEEITQDKLGVMALIAIMEPVPESQSYRA
jgi:chromosome segregation and condensation protein ScpB